MTPTRIVTSLSSKNIARQTYCLNTWKRYGLPIVAVQTEGESALLQEHFPGVEFIETPLGGDYFDKPHLPRISELINLSVDSPILLINSDISIEDTQREFINNWKQEGLVCGIRLNHRRPDSTRVKRNPFGIDAFKIPQGTIVADYGFCIGMPGWDYFLPYELAHRKVPISVSNSNLLHLIHEVNYEDPYIKLGQQLLIKTYGHDQRYFTVAIQKLTHRQRLNYRNTVPQDFVWREL